MDTARWRQISSILDELLDLPREEREAALETAAAGDEELRDDVLAHLRAADEEGALDRTLRVVNPITDHDSAPED